jgi:hypothetical protein
MINFIKSLFKTKELTHEEQVELFNSLTPEQKHEVITNRILKSVSEHCKSYKFDINSGTYTFVVDINNLNIASFFMKGLITEKPSMAESMNKRYGFPIIDKLIEAEDKLKKQENEVYQSIDHFIREQEYLKENTHLEQS